MILDSLGHSEVYAGLHPFFPAAFAWLRALDPEIPDGRYELGDPGLFAIVQSYETAPSSVKKWETHRLYVDIQYMVSGSELIGYNLRESLVIRDHYNEAKDAEFYEPPATCSELILPSGFLAVFLPQDAHQPGVMIDQPLPIRKVVIKFRL